MNAKHYTKPVNVSHAKLVYMNAVIRHHKVRRTEIELASAVADRRASIADTR